MARFSVDVKAFLRCDIEAETVEDAIAEAMAFVEAMSPDEHYLRGWRETRAADGTASGTLIETGSFDCEDTEYVEDEDGNELER
jgi:hypothetical protein